jgi:hypothetical protein
VKRNMIYAALAGLVLAGPAAAQVYGPGGLLPPHEIVRMLRSSGLEPLGQPLRRGPNYVLRAIDDYDREVSVVVSARSGEVLSVTVGETASRLPPPARGGGLTFGPYERMAPGAMPPGAMPPGAMPPGAMPPGAMRPGGYPAGAPLVDEDEPNIAAHPDTPRPPAALPGAPPVRSSNAAPPTPSVITADPDRSGLLPPPPERFPQRAAPVVPAKPIKRAAAAPPKAAPLPKPKPAAKIDTPPAPQAAPEPAPQPAPASEETPH